MRTLALTKRILTQLLRDPRTLALLFLAPVFVMWLVSVMFSANTDTHVTIGTAHVDTAIVRQLDKVDHVSVRRYSSSAEAKKALRHYKVDTIITRTGSTYHVRHANIDSTKTALATQAFRVALQKVEATQTAKTMKKMAGSLAKSQAAAQAATKAAQQAMRQAAAQSGAEPQTQSGTGTGTTGLASSAAPSMAETKKSADTAAKAAAVTIRTSYQYGDSSSNFFTKTIPVFMGFFVFFFVFLISGIGLLTERSSGTLDRLLATPCVVARSSPATCSATAWSPSSRHASSSSPPSGSCTSRSSGRSASSSSSTSCSRSPRWRWASSSPRSWPRSSR